MSNTRKIPEPLPMPEVDYFPPRRQIPYFPGLGTSDPNIHCLEHFARLWGHKPYWAKMRDGETPKLKKFLVNRDGSRMSPEEIQDELRHQAATAMAIDFLAPFNGEIFGRPQLAQEKLKEMTGMWELMS